VGVADVADAHYRRQIGVARRTAQRIGSLWRQVDPGNISASWLSKLSRAVGLLSAAQLLVSADADGYVDDVMAAQGIDAGAAGVLVPEGFAGVASDGRDLGTLLYQPVITTLTGLSGGDSPSRALAGGRFALDMIVRTQVADAGRTAVGAVVVARPRVGGYVRMLSAPSCSRCVVLAGRRYGWSAGFQRHPRLPLRLPAHPRRRGHRRRSDH
jgi:hypothetical protein